jgi:hypothetical protein
VGFHHPGRSDRRCQVGRRPVAIRALCQGDERIATEEPPRRGVVVARAQVLQAGLSVGVLPRVAEGVVTPPVLTVGFL